MRGNTWRAVRVCMPMVFWVGGYLLWCEGCTRAHPSRHAHVSAVEGCPEAPSVSKALPVVTVLFPEARYPSPPSVQAELAVAPEELTRGLMYRTALSSDSGMLFRMPEVAAHRFWMRNTCLPLDMLFLDAQGVLVGLVDEASPLNDTPRGVDTPSAWVLEVQGGWARRHGVFAGQTVKIALPESKIP